MILEAGLCRGTGQNFKGIAYDMLFRKRLKNPKMEGKKAVPNDSEDAIEKDLGEDPEAEAECDRIIGEMSDK
jgi:hypothetical protein